MKYKIYITSRKKETIKRKKIPKLYNKINLIKKEEMDSSYILTKLGFNPRDSKYMFIKK